MTRILAGVALLTSLLAFLAIAGTGVFLASIEQSGVRGAGLLLAATETIGFSAVLFLALAPARMFRKRGGRTIAVAAALLGVVPVAAVAAATLFFVGLPTGSAVPRLDWTLFAVGLLFTFGAVSIAALGYRRLTPSKPRESKDSATALYEPLGAEWMQDDAEADRRSIEIDDGVRVRRA